MMKRIDTYFMKRMIFLTNKLCDVTNTEPYDPDAYNAVLREVNELATVINRDHRRKQILIPVLIILGLLVLAWLVYSILF